MRLEDNDSRHGTANGYNNYGCRCEPCREAWADYIRHRRVSGKADELPVQRGGVTEAITPDGASALPGTYQKGDGSERWHGTLSGYSYHGCRCGKCVPAMTTYQRRWRHSRGHLLERGADAHRATAPLVVAKGLVPNDRLALAQLVTLDDPARIPLLADLDGVARRRDTRRTHKKAVVQDHLTRLGADEISLEGELLELVAEQAKDDRWNRLNEDHEFFALDRLDDKWWDAEDVGDDLEDAA